MEWDEVQLFVMGLLYVYIYDYSRLSSRFSIYFLRIESWVYLIDYPLLILPNNIFFL